MFYHPRITGFAPNLVSTGTAQGNGCISAAVDEQHGLFALQHPRLDMCNQITGHPSVRGQLFLTHVNCGHIGHHSRTKPIRHRNFMILPTLCIDPRFQRGRGRCQNHTGLGDRGPQNRHIPRIIQCAIFLFVGCVMFFIDHNQSQIPKWQIKGRTRTNHQLRTALPHHFPNATAFGHCNA